MKYSKSLHRKYSVSSFIRILNSLQPQSNLEMIWNNKMLWHVQSEVKAASFSLTCGHERDTNVFKNSTSEASVGKLEEK